jgi:hypothetical protein
MGMANRFSLSPMRAWSPRYTDGRRMSPVISKTSIPPLLRDRVHAGLLLARVGASGDAREPHLHFEVTTSPTILAGEGVPYLIKHFNVEQLDGSRTPHNLELPLDKMVVDFAPALQRSPMKNGPSTGRSKRLATAR